jgi:hypothetical protein
MLQIIKTSSPADKSTLIRELLSADRATLIVSDLQSKLYWQTVLSAKVLRASELWQILVKKTQPELYVMDDQATLVRLQRELDQIPDEVYADLNIRKVKPKTLMAHFFELFPLFSHPHTAEIMQYWFNEQKAIAPPTWEPLYYLCKNIWSRLKHENFLPERVISSFLLHSLNYEFQWKTPLIFDLGGNLQTTESELILTLSQQLQVSVIEPCPDWIKDFHWLSWPYQQMKTRSYQELPEKPLANGESIGANQYLRFTNPLSEVQAAISQIQLWLNDGIPANQIYVTAPNIEDYWPALKWHLDNKKLKYNKEARTKLIEILSLRKLIASLKCSFLRSTDKGELEAALYINEETPPLKYADFTHLYSELFSAKDYFRNQKVSEKLNLNSITSQLSAEQFLQIMMDFYNKEVSEYPDINSSVESENNKTLIEEIKENFASSIPPQFRVEIQYWIYYLEQLLQKKEILTEGNKPKLTTDTETDSPTDETEINTTIVAAKSTATNTTKSTEVNIVPLPSIYSVAECNTIFLGLNDSNLKSTGNVISGSDVMSLLNKTGHLLNHPDRNYFEFLLQWSQMGRNRHIFSFSETNWQTEELSPSVFWLLGYSQMPLQTEASIAKFNSEGLGRSFMGLDFQVTDPPLLPAPFKNISTEEIFKTLSPSGLEKLNDCAFKYYVERLLYLNEEKILDLDPSPLTLGNLYHKLCELLTAEPLKFSLSDGEWSDVTEVTLKSSKPEELMDFQKVEIKRKLIEWGKAFLIYEQKWRLDHPESRVFGRELKFSGTLNNIKFLGKIDRMDWDQNNQYSIIDYKSSVSHLSGPLSWIKNNQLQLLCYIYAVEKGWLNNPHTNNNSSNSPKINGAYYLSLRNFDKKGFTLSGCKGSFLSPLSSRSELPKETITGLLAEFEEILFKAIEKLKLGNIEPIPRDEKICHECSWRHLCRAPHLNM